jgi:DNA-binding CsgD family transcriptional regulator/tetratricopeptide (TPR) repeat protein
MKTKGGQEPTPMEVLAQARAHRQAGRYADALALLATSEEWPLAECENGTSLRAQILARIQPLEALSLLARTQDVFETDEGKFCYLLASMRAYIGTHNFEAAAEMSARASALEDGVTLANRCSLWHQRGLLRICLEHYNPLDENVQALISSGDPNGGFLGLVIRAYMYAALGRYNEQAADLTAALEVAASHPGACDPGIIASQVHALLRLGLEMGNHAFVSAAADAYEWMPWSDDLKNERFLCVRALAWDAFLRGESAQAQWLLKDSKALASSDAWRLMAHLDRAYVARMNGNEPWAAEELSSAHALARNVVWSATHGEERQALVMLAVLFSPTDMAAAQQYVSLYMQLGRANIDPLLTLATDRRGVGFEKYALGRVAQVLGNDSLAVQSFQAAYEIFDGAGYHFRAALAAMGLFETTRDAAWLESARAHAEFFPRSALRATLAHESTASENARLRDLTPMQRQIAFALCEGLDLAQLSQRFSRSAFTLSKHVDAVYTRLGAKNAKTLRNAVQGWTFV